MGILDCDLRHQQTIDRTKLIVCDGRIREGTLLDHSLFSLFVLLTHEPIKYSTWDRYRDTLFSNIIVIHIDMDNDNDVTCARYHQSHYGTIHA